MPRFCLFCLLLALGAAGCSDSVPDALFTRLDPAEAGLVFENRIEETQELNVFTYRNFYNGGGVGIGDLDGDGRPDVYLTANQGPNKLFLNRTEVGGPIRFEDVTETAGVAGARAWSTGITLADVNADGRLDLYVSNAGTADGADRANELFVNEGPGPDGIPRFREVAAAWGVADEGTSTHGAFLDADLDGDLDLYVLNNSFRPVSSFGLRNIRDERNARGGDKLYLNEGTPEAPRFVDASERAGIYGSEIAFGLGVTLGDVNGDGALDIYVSNDFFERDYLYLANGDGTFREVLDAAMPSISTFSMGADMADLTGDGRPEVFVVDMLPWDDARLKRTSTYEGVNSYRAKLANDYHHQFMRNTLQRNNAEADGDPTFDEVGMIAGVAETDWSWSALFADLDLDGAQDLFVTNGLLRDVTDQDYIDFLADTQTREAMATGDGADFLALTEAMPSTPLSNIVFQNVGRRDSLAFQRRDDWGLADEGFSAGAATADLDGDGDLDLVVNNENEPAAVYESHAAERFPDRQALRISLQGEGGNTGGIGARVEVWSEGLMQLREAVPTRGFQSSVDPVLHVGLGTATTADSLTIRWPDGRLQTLRDVPAGALTLRQTDAGAARAPALPPPRPLLRRADAGISWAHAENPTNDFDRERLMPRLVSTEGPAAAAGDLDGDGADDLFVGGAIGQPGAVFLRRGDRLVRQPTPALDADAAHEDVAAAIFDADGDGYPDLVVGSGGYEVEAGAPILRDRLYLGDGRGGLAAAPDGALPTTAESTGALAPLDIDGDGDLDLFVGARVVPGAYGTTPRSALLRNDSRPGAPRFVDVTRSVAPGLDDAGLVTDALATDWDGDGADDLVVAGEWMPITVWTRDGDTLTPTPLGGTAGLWNRLAVADLDGDGDPDLVGGNLGLNTPLRTTDGPLRLFVSDFDGNGQTEPLLSITRDDRNLPFALRRELTAQLPTLKREVLKFSDYATRSVEDLFSATQLERATVRSAAVLATAVVENRGASVTVRPLPFDAQTAPMYGLLTHDLDGDGHLDLLLAGTFDGVKPDLGRMAASAGVTLLGDGSGRFQTRTGSGFRVPGQTRHLVRLDAPGGPLVVAVRNDDAPLVFALPPLTPDRP